MFSSVGGVTFTDIPDSTIFQYPHANGTPGTFPVITGTYIGEPTSISAKIIKWTDGSIVKDWTIIKNIPSGGVFSDTLKDIPRDSGLCWYRLIVKTSLGDTSISSTHWSVGEIIACAGQSNIGEKWMHDSLYGLKTIAHRMAKKWVRDSTPPNIYKWQQLCEEWQNAWEDKGIWKSLVPDLANNILLDTKYSFPVGICGHQQGGTTLVTPSNGNMWHKRPGILYDSLIMDIKDVKPAYLVYYQGESDYLETTAAWMAAWSDMISWLPLDLGYTPTVFLVQIRETGDPIIAYQPANRIQLAQSNLWNDTTVYSAACTYDLTTMVDGIHLDRNGQIKAGTRIGKAIARHLNDSTQYGYRGPRITKATAIERGKIRLSVKITDNKTLGDVTTDRFSYRTNNSVYQPVLSATKLNDTAIIVTVPDRSMLSDSMFIEYDKYRKVSSPTSGVIYDSDSLPMEPSR